MDHRTFKRRFFACVEWHMKVSAIGIVAIVLIIIVANAIW
jgi:hypothetical protein